MRQKCVQNASKMRLVLLGREERSKIMPNSRFALHGLAPHYPVLLFLGVFISLVFFLLRNSLVFLSISVYFPRFFEVCKVRKTLGVFEVFLVLSIRPRKRRTGSIGSVTFPWCFCFLGVFLAAKFLGLFECFLSIFSGFLRVCKVRKILGVSEVLLGLFEKTKEKRDRDCSDILFPYRAPLSPTPP